MIREQQSILDDTAGTAEVPQRRVDADLVTTLVVVGFTAGRLAVGQPVEYGWEAGDAEGETATKEAVAAIARAVGRDGDRIRATPAPDWEVGSLITGAAGGARTPFAERHAVPTTESAQALREIAARDTAVGYQGVGAYTGLVDVPFTNKGSVSSTARFAVPVDGFGDRWRPARYSYGDGTQNQGNAPWGLLNDGKDIPGMVTRDGPGTKIVGYTHGMVQSVYTAVSQGPWCTPFEIAVGSRTKKVASCFACTTLMYAAGFPPSTIHLGRGDSWLPFYPVAPGVQGYSVAVDEAIRSTNTRWALECGQQLRLGASLAARTPFLAPTHAARLPVLNRVLEARSGDLWAAANLFLDALTVADSFTKRIARAVVAR